MSTLLSLEHVELSYGGAPVLRDLSLTLSSGETLAILGPSGAGKSSLLRLVMGLEALDSGLVRLRGEVASRARRIIVPPEARKIAVVFQDLALWPHMTVEANLAFGLRARRIRGDEARRRIERTIAEVGLAGATRRYPAELSGGERQRVAIARALVVDPDLILFDEPLASLDIALRREILDLFERLLTARGVAVLFVTHDPVEAKRLASRVALIEAGRLTYLGPIDELGRNPPTDFARIVGEHLARKG